MKRTEELEALSKKLGFEKAMFLETDLVLITAPDKKKMLDEIKEAKRKNLFTIYRPKTEEMLRFALEKTPVDAVLGLELIHPKESLHHRRGGLDQILCQMAQSQEKIIAFSFRQLLQATNQAQVLGRMRFNLRLCRKYRLKTIFGNFSQEKEEMRSAKDLQAFWHALGG